MENIEKMTEEQVLSKETFDKVIKLEGFKRTEIQNKLKLRAKKLSIAKMYESTHRQFMIDHVKKNRSESGYKTNFPDAPEICCGDWIADEYGIKKNEVNFQTGQTTLKEASRMPIYPLELLQNMDTGVEKVKLKYKPEDTWREVICEKVTVSSNSKIVELANKGIDVTTDNAKLLVKYLYDCITMNTLPRYKSISRLGWVDNKFMPYDNDLVFDGENEYKYLFDSVSQAGNYFKWVDYIKPLRKNLYFRLMLDASFSSPLISKVGALPYIFHLWGGTGAGKTVALMAAMSIWGNPEPGKFTRTLNMTQNSMMSTASFLHHLPFGADELQTIKSRFESYDTLIMKLTEGIDRGRMSYDKVNEIKSWKCAFLFTGEEPCTKTSSGGGVKNRVIELECEAKVVEDGNSVVNFITSNYGYAGQRYIDEIRSIDLVAEYNKIFKHIISKEITTDKQAMAMSLILLADKITSEKIFKDKPLEVEEVKQFLTDPNEVDVPERAYEFTKSLIAQNINKFNEKNFENESWGCITGGFLYFNKNVLSRELTKEGFEFEAVKKKWADKGYILKNTADRFIHQRKINGVTTSYVKVFIEDSDDCPF